MDLTDLENRFTYHAPKNADMVDTYATMRSSGFALAQYINDVCPESREKSLAITKLEEVVMWANAAIARGN